MDYNPNLIYYSELSNTFVVFEPTTGLFKKPANREELLRRAKLYMNPNYRGGKVQ